MVASLDLWLNLGLSWLEKATRLSRLEFGRIIFEFGRPVVPDLTTAVGNLCFPASSGTTALIGAVLPPPGRGTTVAYQIPSCSCHPVILFVEFSGLCSFFLVVLRVLVFGSR